MEARGTRTADLEALVRGMYVRGPSTQDVSDLDGEAFGELVEKSTVSRISQQLDAGLLHLRRKRDLSQSPWTDCPAWQYDAARQGSDEKEGAPAYARRKDGRLPPAPRPGPAASL